MVTAIVADIPNAEVRVMKNKYLCVTLNEIGATHVFRGLRDYKDLSEEQVARSVNKVIAPNIDGDYFIPDADKFEISSSMVLSLIGFEGWEEIVSHYVHPVVLIKLINWHYTRQHWFRFWNEIDAQDDRTVMWNNIVSRYGEDHRSYHNLTHITLVSPNVRPGQTSGRKSAGRGNGHLVPRYQVRCNAQRQRSAQRQIRQCLRPQNGA